jgi:C1A family cysteine protease
MVSDLSRLFLYYNTRLADGRVVGDAGATIRGTIKAARRAGVCLESLWPYDVKRFAERPPAVARRDGLRRQVIGYARADGLDGVLGCLAEGLPVVFGFAVYEHVMGDEVTRSGDVRMPGKDERMLGGHAVLGVGYRKRERQVIIRNSWGMEWGDKGYGTLPFGYFEEGLAEDCWVVRVVEGGEVNLRKI